VEDLPISIRLEGIDTDQWSAKSNQIQDEFSNALCQAFSIPIENIRIIKVDYGTGTIYAHVLAPYGKNVIDSLNGTAPDSAARIEAVRKCCLAIKAEIGSITLGDFDLSIDQKLMDPTWNRQYVWTRSDDDDGQYWQKPIDRGGRPYFCPSGL
jgi:hypothetical protein